jgi:uncharacterized membrane protein
MMVGNGMRIPALSHSPTTLERLRQLVPMGGVFLGLIFFSLALTPSLIPRNFVLQGILCGVAFAAGYGIGAFIEWLWGFMGLGFPNKRLSRAVLIGGLAAAALVALVFLWQSTGWQNAVREIMGLPPVESNQPVWVTIIALGPAAILIILGTIITAGVRAVSRFLAQAIPPRVALVGSLIIVGVLTNILINGVLARSVLSAADRFYAEVDALAGQYEDPPLHPLQSGSAASLIDWDTIGEEARAYVESGPSAEEIAAITGKPAIMPLRVYVGLRSAETVDERAQLALAEMQRIGAFDRSVLVLIMPVGTGWVDPPAIDTLEMLHGGDVASVAVQYSYLTSWLSLVSEPEVGTETARALFNAVYRFWTELPRDSRPRLYLHGLSLGAYASQASVSPYAILSDPFQGALWVGPPFESDVWRWATSSREPGTPEWLPQFEDRSAIRFVNQRRGLEDYDQGWGPVRLVYLQYASDPVVFFEPSILYRPPDWLEGPRARDVSPLLSWYPVVTFMQVLLDMVLAQTSPVGFGHVYAPQDYLDSWVAVTAPAGWSESELDMLRKRLTRHGSLASLGAGWFRTELQGASH